MQTRVATNHLGSWWALDSCLPVDTSMSGLPRLLNVACSPLCVFLCYQAVMSCSGWIWWLWLWHCSCSFYSLDFRYRAVSAIVLRAQHNEGSADVCLMFR